MTGHASHSVDGTGHVRGDAFDTLLAATHDGLGTAVADRINAQGGPPELRTPDLALDRLLTATHRSLGEGVNRRLSQDACDALVQRGATLRTDLAARGALAHRPAAIRIKHREEALRLMRRYWPRDLVAATCTAVRIVQELCDHLGDTTQPFSRSEALLDKVRAHLEATSRLPEPCTPPLPLQLDYLSAVEAALAGPAERLANELHSIRELLDEEVAPTIAALQTAGRSYLFGANAVTQDLIDDLARCCEEADTLAKVVAEVERASNDFVGADLTSAQLDGLLLEGVLWDTSTLWPPQWEMRVRRMSLPCDAEEGILVIVAEGADSVVHAEA